MATHHLLNWDQQAVGMLRNGCETLGCRRIGHAAIAGIGRRG